jgi:hypothetical protein
VTEPLDYADATDDEIEQAWRLLATIVDAQDPGACHYEYRRCVVHDVEFDVDRGCPVAQAGALLAGEMRDEPDADDRPVFTMRVGPNRQVVEIDGRAWHLAEHSPGVLGLGAETHTAADIQARTVAMLDAVVAWHDVHGQNPRALGSEGAVDVTRTLIDDIAAWREVANR